MLSPNIALAITEHSICQPGRPGPHGDGHEGSPDFDAFHRAKSDGERLPVVIESAPVWLTVIPRIHFKNFNGQPSPSASNSLFPLLQGSNFA